MDDSEPNLAEIRILARLVSAMDAGREDELAQLRRELGWPLGRLLRELKRAGLIEDAEPLPLP